MSQKDLRIIRRTSFINSMFIVGRMNPVGFLDSTCIAVAGRNHLMNYLLG